MSGKPKRLRLGGPQMARVLRTLYEADGRIVSFGRLIEAMYFDDPRGGPPTASQVLKVCIYHLRRLLPKDSITTVWGVGYRLAAEARPLALQHLPVENGDPQSADDSKLFRAAGYQRDRRGRRPTE